jgi:hypothetical protein
MNNLFAKPFGHFRESSQKLPTNSANLHNYANIPDETISTCCRNRIYEQRLSLCNDFLFFCMLFDCFQLFRCNFRLLFSLMSNLCTTLAGILNHTCTNSACDSCSELHHRVFSCLTSSDSFRSVPGRQPPPEQRLTIRVVGSLG